MWWPWLLVKYLETVVSSCGLLVPMLVLLLPQGPASVRPPPTLRRGPGIGSEKRTIQATAEIEHFCYPIG
jgi:hypothetical protein